ncbi:DUF6944 family repetitive protein [Mesobacillus subterraneus]|uniref:Uncharacterized protein n=1 Tax=Mesobacillus subterraneus TaxID=285983 RepID=A0A427TL54_9BACI|nr:hypothetical protein [Mesobacillus subterraneus]RSD25089.1 hypothetical protein EJA10_17605 [Mesobacillus subterraneus]
MDQKNQEKELFGAWVQAGGTTLAAVGSTPLGNFSESQLISFNLWGNVLQATGNALMADSEAGFSMEKIGNQIQASGNVTVVAGFFLPVSNIAEQELYIKGNFIQALGGSTALSDTLKERPSVDGYYSLYGHLLQIVGNSMQGIGGIIDLRGGDGETIIVAGSWIQAAGSLIHALGYSKNYLDKSGSKAEKYLFPPQHYGYIHNTLQR